MPTDVFGPIEPCAAFLRDVEAMKKIFGPNSVSFHQIEAFVEGTYRAKVELFLDPAPLLNKMVCECYGVDRNSPIILRMTVGDISSYNESRDMKMECLQTTRACTLAAQLQRIFAKPGRLSKIWDDMSQPVTAKQVEEKKGFLTSLFGKKEKEKEKPPPKAAGKSPPPAPVFPPAKRRKSLTQKQQENKTALLGMGFDEKLSERACRIAKTADHAAHIIMETPGKLDHSTDEEIEESPSRGDLFEESQETGPVAEGEHVGIPPRRAGFLVQVMDYAIERIRTCSTYCVICDQTHVFAGGPMLKPAVCSRELCVFAFQDLKVGSDAADLVATDPGVIDLLICMLKAAAFSGRTDRILSPYPSVVDPRDPKKLALNPKSPDNKLLQDVLRNFPSVRVLTEQGDIRTKMDSINPLSFPLMTWCISSNRSHIVKLQEKDQIPSMCTPHQYMLLTAPPEKQAKFNALKAKHGSKFAFHGSNIENWHCILREGLKNASGTALQLNGAAHGSGIYFATTAATSIGYCRSYTLETGGSQVDPKAGGKDYINERNMICLALCEIVNKEIKDHGWCWTLEPEDHCMTRFFFVYSDSQTGNAGSAETKNDAFMKEVMHSMKLHAL
jgi:hypothetical protein